jgi:hypothetical protein
MFNSALHSFKKLYFLSNLSIQAPLWCVTWQIGQSLKDHQILICRHNVSVVTLFLGNPPQRLIAIMNAQESAVIVLDANCVENALKVQATCKKYCQDCGFLFEFKFCGIISLNSQLTSVKFCKIHCHPICCESLQNIRSFCYNRVSMAYNQTATKTFRRPTDESKRLVECFWMLKFLVFGFNF